MDTHAHAHTHTHTHIQESGTLTVLGHVLTASDVLVRYAAVPGTEGRYASTTDGDIVVLLDGPCVCVCTRVSVSIRIATLGVTRCGALPLRGAVKPTTEMLDEGLARVVVNKVQKLRKTAKLMPKDPIRVRVRVCVCVCVCVYIPRGYSRSP